jgi:hypothetical protein
MPGTASLDTFLEVKVCPAVGLEPRSSRLDSGSMTPSGDEFLRLEGLIFRPVSTRPDGLKAWRNEANYLLYLAPRASDDDDIDVLEELEEQARETADWSRRGGRGTVFEAKISEREAIFAAFVSRP